jgi:hypothetical protein
MLRRAAALLITATFLLGGCAAQRTAEDDRAVRSVGVISLLNESTPVRHFGLTVFNNHPANVEQGGKLKQVVGETVKQRLNSTRPQWTVKLDDTDPGALIDKNRNLAAVEDFAPKHAKDLAAIAQRLDADLLFVLLDSTGQNHPGQGVGITFRAVSNDPDTVSVHSFITLYVIDRNGKELIRRGAINGNPLRVSNSALGLRSDMSTLNDPKVRDSVSLTLTNHLKAAVEESMTRAGY